MAQISKYRLRKEIEERMYEVFLDSISMVQNRNHVSKLINDLLSPTEKIMLAKRLSIALLLMKQYQYRSIAQLLHVSYGTVNRVGRMLESGNGGYVMVLSVLLKQEKFVSFLNKIDDILAEIFIPYNRNLGEWRKKRWIEKVKSQSSF
ncbi:MAG: hypothetical protein UV63_C0006G0027 [Microgenomates group bacterium GW2011_GWC1_43_11]|uniref:TrpR like protein, YerC/YecD n=2 Tax=Candidatus Gottesmaniibacteriota TaxID=1752720 RepID=A0A0G1KWX5_9BACT|nr:MAG: hypothetical protein UV63_C0006G0027 [Microgenomates group bacterium GW2011_GWC1_43_11]KKT38625.1 MAG: hypothetical protein UW22_C0009G0031 [Candidatus Gottesmanbacteria bacterium GW2011_GWB1_44_11c]KKT60817.1 MAG: hypothetical protein UW52_C0017G0028 [Candidatus Gottesmanbacteria bacterium GW2011_GWA1_44_24b]HCM82288.1 hypothetical protein [Patescibacteria group bacterium]